MTNPEGKQINLNKAVLSVGAVVAILLGSASVIVYAANLRSDVNYLQNRVAVLENKADSFQDTDKAASDRILVLEAQFETILETLNDIKNTLKSK